jgi:hypothetical protein
MRIRSLVVVLALAGVLAPGLGGAEYPSKETMLKLNEGMTMDQIKGLLGTPDSVSSAVCGGASGKPWQCRTWRYEGEIHRLDVTFGIDGKTWRVSSWMSI